MREGESVFFRDASPGKLLMHILAAWSGTNGLKTTNKPTITTITTTIITTTITTTKNQNPMKLEVSRTILDMKEYEIKLCFNFNFKAIYVHMK